MVKQYSLFPEKKPTIGIVDIETTGFFNQKGVIVEIGIASLNLETGEIKPVFNSLVREPSLNERHTKAPYGWIFTNSTLKFEDVCNAPSLASLFEEIQKIFDRFSEGLTAYNTAFDFEFLRARSFRFKELPCPMLAATPVVNLPSNGWHKTPKWPKVQETWDFLFGADTGYIETHRAMDDAMHEAKIVYELYKNDHYILK